MSNNTKEFYDLMKIFEATVAKKYGARLDKEEKSNWDKSYYYQAGDTNHLFLGFLSGYQLAKSLARQEALPLDG